MARRTPKEEPSAVDLDVLTPNPNALDSEWIAQPRLYMEASEKYAQAKQFRDECKRDVDLKLAELKMDIRDNPKKYNLEKTTNDIVDNVAALEMSEVKETAALIQATHMVEVLGAYVSAVETKRRALENLAELWIAGYYSEPRAKSEGVREVMQEAKQRRARRAGREQ